jgi:predicted thioesterase
MFVQRFGSAANLTPHFHSIVFDATMLCVAATKNMIAVAERVAVSALSLPSHVTFFKDV